MIIPPSSNWYTNKACCWIDFNTVAYAAKSNIVFVSNSIKSESESTRIFSAHNARVNCVTAAKRLLSDTFMSFVISACTDGEVKLWSVLDWTCLESHTQHDGTEITCITKGFDENDGQVMFITGDKIGRIVWWKPKTVRLRCQTKSFTPIASRSMGGITALAFSRNVVIGYKSGCIIIFDIVNSVIISRLTEHNSDIHALQFYPQIKYPLLLSTSRKGVCVIFNTETWVVETTFSMPEESSLVATTTKNSSEKRPNKHAFWFSAIWDPSSSSSSSSTVTSVDAGVGMFRIYSSGYRGQILIWNWKRVQDALPVISMMESQTITGSNSITTTAVGSIIKQQQQHDTSGVTSRIFARPHSQSIFCMQSTFDLIHHTEDGSIYDDINTKFLVASVSVDRSICIWRARNKNSGGDEDVLEWSVQGLGGAVLSIAVSPPRVVEKTSYLNPLTNIRKEGTPYSSDAGGGLNTVFTWDLAIGAEMFIQLYNPPISDDADNASTSLKSLWNKMQDGNGESKMKSKISCMAFHPYIEGLIGYGLENGSIGTVNILTNESTVTLRPPHRNGVIKLEWRMLKIGRREVKTQVLYSVGDGVLMETISGDEGTGNGSRDGFLGVVSGCLNPFLLNVCNHHHHKQQQHKKSTKKNQKLALKKNEFKISNFAFNYGDDDFDLLVTGFFDGSVRVFAISDGSVHDYPSNPMTNGGVSPPIQLICEFKDHLNLVSALSWQIPHVTSSTTGVFATDNKNVHSHVLASGDCSGKIIIYDIVPSTSTSTSTSLVSDEILLDDELDAITSSQLRTSFKMHSYAISCLKWSPYYTSNNNYSNPHNMNYLASSSFDGTVQVWNVTSKQPICNFRGHLSRVLCMAWHPIDCDVLITGSDDQTIRFWDIKKSLHLIPPSKGEITFSQRRKKKNRNRNNNGNNTTNNNKKNPKFQDSIHRNDVNAVTTDIQLNIDPGIWNDHNTNYNTDATTMQKNISTANTTTTYNNNDTTTTYNNNNNANSTIKPKPNPNINTNNGNINATTHRSRKPSYPYSQGSPLTDVPNKAPLYQYTATQLLPTQSRSSEVVLKEAVALVESKLLHTSIPSQSYINNNDNNNSIKETAILWDKEMALELLRTSITSLKKEVKEINTNTSTTATTATTAAVDTYKPPSLGLHVASALCVWAGDIGEALDLVIRNDCITATWVALSPAAGVNIWRALSHLYALQLESVNDIHTAVLFHIANHNILGAIQAYMKIHAYENALMLARSRLDASYPSGGDSSISENDNNEVILKILKTWAAFLVNGGNYLKASLVYSALNQPLEAATCVVKLSTSDIITNLNKEHGSVVVELITIASKLSVLGGDKACVNWGLQVVGVYIDTKESYSEAIDFLNLFTNELQFIKIPVLIERYFVSNNNLSINTDNIVVVSDEITQMKSLLNTTVSSGVTSNSILMKTIMKYKWVQNIIELLHNSTVTIALHHEYHDNNDNNNNDNNNNNCSSSVTSNSTIHVTGDCYRIILEFLNQDNIENNYVKGRHSKESAVLATVGLRMTRFLLFLFNQIVEQDNNDNYFNTIHGDLVEKSREMFQFIHSTLEQEGEVISEKCLKLIQTIQFTISPLLRDFIGSNELIRNSKNK